MFASLARWILVEMKLQSLSTHPHADGKPGEVSQSTKHFWSLAEKQRSSILLLLNT